MRQRITIDGEEYVRASTAAKMLGYKGRRGIEKHLERGILEVWQPPAPGGARWISVVSIERAIKAGWMNQGQGNERWKAYDAVVGAESMSG